MFRQAIRAYSTKKINEKWGKAVFEASVIGLLKNDHNAMAKLDIILSEGAVRLIAMAQNQSLAQFYTHIGYLRDKRGYSVAHQYVRDATASYITPSSISLNDIPKSKLPILETPSKLETYQVDSDEMDLFDSESWLRDSPIAQQKWRES